MDGDGRATRGARLARGSAAAVLATLIAACSHALGGGAFPAAPLLLAGLLAAVIGCTTLAGRSVSLPRLLPAVGLSQSLFHVLFATAPAAGATLPPTVPHHATAPAAHLIGSAMTVDAASAHAHADTSMLVAHVIAALLTAIALRFGEAAFWGLFDSLRLALASLLSCRAVPLVQERRPTRPILVEAVHLLVAARFLVATPRRGPPAALRAA
ncbi:MAG: hypothetical protein RI885_1224 [Actinomycetota bacterium]|jgi:hypothetical protein